MDFYSFHLLINQLAKHPQIHPNTQVEVEFDRQYGNEDVTNTREPLLSISVEPGRLLFSTKEHSNAVGR